MDWIQLAQNKVHLRAHEHSNGTVMTFFYWRSDCLVLRKTCSVVLCYDLSVAIHFELLDTTWIYNFVPLGLIVLVMRHSHSCLPSVNLDVRGTYTVLPFGRHPVAILP